MLQAFDGRALKGLKRGKSQCHEKCHTFDGLVVAIDINNDKSKRAKGNLCFGTDALAIFGLRGLYILD